IIKYLYSFIVFLAIFSIVSCTTPRADPSGKDEKDNSAPAGAVILGVSEGETYTGSLYIIWTSAPGTTSKGTLAKDGGSAYTIYSPHYVSSNGTYILTVTVTKTSNSLTAATVINFTIDSIGPSAPVITGVTNNALYNNPVTPVWTDAGGTTSEATLQKNSGTAVNYISGPS